MHPVSSLCYKPQQRTSPRRPKRMPIEHPPIEKISFPDNADAKRQAFEVPGTRQPGQTGHYRNAAFPYLDKTSPGVLKTLPECFAAGFAKSADRPFLGHRPVISTSPLTFAKHYVWQTYRQVDEKRRILGSGIDKLFQDGAVGGGELPTVGIWSQNRPEWQILDLAFQAYSKVGVSLYDTLGPDSVEYIIGHANLTLIFATSQHLSTLLKLAPKVPMLKVIVSIDPLIGEAKNVLQAWGKMVSVQIMDLFEIEALGKKNMIDIITPTPDQIATICYTSGTTNTPKGAILTHGNLAFSTHSAIHGANFSDNGRLLSYLPLAHIYERIVELIVLTLGGQIGYFTGDPLRLLEDAQILKPTYFPSVPRVLNRVYQAAMLAGDIPGLRGNLFRKAVAVKLERLRTTGDNTHAFWDKLVFRKVRAVLGGALESVTSGSAPISPEALDFLKIAFACDVIEGYGMTENCATCTRSWNNDPTATGTVGPPQPGVDIKLVDVPAMGYHADNKPNPRGEICIRGEVCFKGYYKDPKNTTETIDKDGWLRTGDIGEFDEYGRLKIIDRVKNIMKLAQGEYVAVEKIENMYAASSLIQQLYVHGDSLQDYLIGVLVPDPPVFAKLVGAVTSKQVAAEDVMALTNATKDPRVIEAALTEINKEARRAGLKGFETVKRLLLTMEPFTVENGLLTPTFKVRRRDAYQKYKDELDSLYAQGPVSENTIKL